MPPVRICEGQYYNLNEIRFSKNQIHYRPLRQECLDQVQLLFLFEKSYLNNMLFNNKTSGKEIIYLNVEMFSSLYMYCLLSCIDRLHHDGIDLHRGIEEYHDERHCLVLRDFPVHVPFPEAG